MRTPAVYSPPGRRHWLLAALAVTHALAITVSYVLMTMRGYISGTEENIWVGVATLWLLWPVVLMLHAGRSVLRIAAGLCVSLFVLLPVFGAYRSSAPMAFGLPAGVDLSPWAIHDYFVARAGGRADAERDLRAGHLALELFGLPPPSRYRDALQQHQIELRQTAGCTDVTETTMGHADGYNEVSEREIKKRFGETFLRTVQEESYREEQLPEQT